MAAITRIRGRRRRLKLARSRQTRVRDLRFDPPPDDLEGGAGVREPRRPRPSAPGDALVLAEPDDQRLDLVG